MYEYRQILVRMRLGDSDRLLAKARLVGRRKAGELRRVAQAQGWLKLDSPLPDDSRLAEVLQPAPGGEEPRRSGSRVEPYRAQVTAWWDAGIQATTIHQALVREHGFSGSYFAVQRFVKALGVSRPKATVILEFAPGEAAQVDFGRGPEVVDVHSGERIRSWVFVMTLCWSRHQYAELVRDQRVATWLGCHRRAFEWFGGVPERLIIDNAQCAITRACWQDPEVQRAYAELAEGYRFRIDPCPPGQPQKKGRVEAGVKFIKRGFLPLREFRRLGDGNQQLQDWILAVGNRVHGSTRQRPLTQFTEVERTLLTPLPAVVPALATWTRPKVHRDGHVQFEQCLYSVPYRLVGQHLWLKITETLAQAFHAHQLVATHPRLHQAGQRSTLPDHLPPEAVAYLQQDGCWCLAQAETVGPSCQRLIERLLTDPVVMKRRAAQSVIRLAQRYSPQRLERACERALAFDNPRYRAVKAILEKGLDQGLSPEQAFDALADCYTRGRFCRDTRQLLSH